MTGAEEVAAMVQLRVTIDGLRTTPRGCDLLRRLLIIMKMSE